MASVALCMICKNEKQNIAGLMDDVCDVLEEVHVVDTGSTDGTLEILKQKMDQYPNLKLHHFDWCDDFSKARNFSFSLPGNVDWIFWVDGDDRVDKNGLVFFKNNILDSRQDVDVWLLTYIYSKLPDGSPQSSLTRERFLRKSKNPFWVGAIHEVIDIHHLRQENYYDLKIEHNRDGKFIEPKRNLRILEKEFEKNPNDHRTAYYYAKELFDHIDPKAKEKLIHYIKLPYKYWDDEIGARFRLAKIYLAENNLREALFTIDFVYHLDGTRRRSEYYFVYGEVEFALKNYKVAIDWYKRCLYDPPGSPRVINLEYWTWHPNRKIAMSYKEIGDWENCFKYADAAMAYLPNDSGTMSWYKSLQSYRLQPKPNSDKSILEFGTDFFEHSYKYGKEPLSIKHNDSSFTCNWTFKDKTPFASNSIDGVVSFSGIPSEEITRIIKPCGFILLSSACGIPAASFAMLVPGLWNYLGEFDIGGHTFRKYIKIDPSKMSLGYFILNSEPAQYRYRILNLVNSAKITGHRVVTNPESANVDVFIGLQIPKKYGKTNVLEICEKLEFYDPISIENADVLNCCSPLLTKYIKEKFPNKLVMNVDDHFELPEKEWLVGV